MDHWVHEYSRLVKKHLGPHLKRLVLFGSQARGEAQEGSDYDILMIVDNRTKEVREKALDIAVEMMNRYEKLFSALIYDENEWNKAQMFPLAWNIRREGISL